MKQLECDGYVLIMWNPNRDISWHEDVWGEELEQLSIEQLNAAGGLMFGRVTYRIDGEPLADAQKARSRTS